MWGPSPYLTPAPWYLELGDTPEERRKKYIELCDEYYYGEKLPEKKEAEEVHAFGEERFVSLRHRLLSGIMARIRDRRLPQKTLDRYFKILTTRRGPYNPTAPEPARPPTGQG